MNVPKVNGRLGFRITVESQYPPNVVVKTIEDALEDIDDFLGQMSSQDFEMSKTAVINTKGQNVLSMRDQSQMIWREIAEQTYNFSRHIKEVSSMSRLDLLSIRTFYRTWIHSKASERSCVIISISPDPILNRIEPKSIASKVQHWSLGELDQFRAEFCTQVKLKKVPKEWFQSVFDTCQFIYPPPFFDEEED